MIPAPMKEAFVSSSCPQLLPNAPIGYLAFYKVPMKSYTWWRKHRENFVRNKKKKVKHKDQQKKYVKKND